MRGAREIAISLTEVLQDSAWSSAQSVQEGGWRFGGWEVWPGFGQLFRANNTLDIFGNSWGRLSEERFA